MPVSFPNRHLLCDLVTSYTSQNCGLWELARVRERERKKKHTTPPPPNKQLYCLRLNDTQDSKYDPKVKQKWRTNNSNNLGQETRKITKMRKQNLSISIEKIPESNTV